MTFKHYTLTEIQNGKADRPVRIFCDGVYDLFHIGHVESLRQAKEAFPNVYLMVAVCRDEDVLHHKGRPTVMNYEERCRAVAACRYVDEVLVDHTYYYYPLEYLDEIGADVVAHDALPYVAGRDSGDDFFKDFKQADRFLGTLRTSGISTTDLVNRILADVEGYNKKNNALKCPKPSNPDG